MDKKKNIIKGLLSKLPVFLFCVVFIQGYNYLFGVENSIVGVAILTGFFMFLRGDMGFDVKQASLSIVMCFILMGIGSRLSLINPFLGIVVNCFVIGLMLVLSSHDLSQGNHIPFLMGYIFCQGYDVQGDLYSGRMLSLVLGGILVGGVYYLVNRKKEYKRTIVDLFREMDFHSIRTQWYIRMIVTLTLTMFIGDMFHYPRMMWISLAVLSLTTPFKEEHAARGKVRIPAAILGTALFYVLFQLLIPEQYQTIVVMLAGFGAMFIQNYFIKSIYNSFSSLGAAVLLFATQDALILRVVSNIIGTVTAAFSYLFFNRIFRRNSIQE